ncbi:hypothetical protein, partial [Serratia sp. ME43]|uniref:hypothetical protein n=1 Tax=Serratia sp. ME43 TaxID=2744256 RepID=UPI001C7124E0
ILFFEPSLTERTQKRLTQESEILHGIEQRHFTLFLQPQIDMLSRAPYLPCGTGFESQKLSHQFLLASSKFFPMSAVHPLSTPF